MISVRFQGKPLNIRVIKVDAQNTDAKEVEIDYFLLSSMKTNETF